VLFSACLYRTNTTEESLVDKPFRKILVIKMRFHGDMLLTTPVISTLKQNYPDAKIDVLLYQDTMPILSENPEINALYGIKNKKVKTAEKIANFAGLIKTLRARRYDLIINLTDQWMVALLVRLLNVPVRISQDYSHRQSSFWRNSFTQLAPLVGENVVESNLSVLAFGHHRPDRVKNKLKVRRSNTTKNITLEQNNNEYFLEEVRDAEAWSEPGGNDRRG
jgi:predicted lipopolysaccharide heptosyltransferase III